jgi:hypothetical protein
MQGQERSDSLHDGLAVEGEATYSPRNGVTEVQLEASLLICF